MKNYVKPLQKALVFLLSTVLLYSCNQIETFETPDLSLDTQEKIGLTFKNPLENFRVKDGVNACAVQDFELNVGNGKYMDLGEVSVYKDSKKLYVTISVKDESNPWFIYESKLFIGKITKLGIKKNPAPGKFPHAAEIDKSNNTGDKEYTFEFPLEDFEGLGVQDFALHADFVRVKTDLDGNIIFTDGKAEIVQKEGAWVNGQKFTENQASWGTYFVYDIDKACDVSCNPIFTSVLGVLDRLVGSNAAVNDEESIVFPLFNEGNAIGIIEVTFNRQGKVNSEFTIDTDIEDVDFEEVAIKYVLGNSGVDTDFSNISKTTSADNDGNWKFSAPDVLNPDTNRTIQVAVYAKLKGVCD